MISECYGGRRDIGTHTIANPKNITVHWRFAFTRISKNRKLFKKLQNSDVDFIYRVNRKDGYILFNQNGVEPGLGDLGGVLAVIRNSSQFNSSQFTDDLIEVI